MELENNICLFCDENTTVFSNRDSNLYFRLINKNIFGCSNVSETAFMKLYLSKCLCIKCAYEIEIVINLINHLINSFDENVKTLSSTNCFFCNELSDCLILHGKMTETFQNDVDDFFKSITKKELNSQSWKICLKCSVAITNWCDLKRILNQMLKRTTNENKTPVVKVKRLGGMPDIETKLKKHKIESTNQLNISKSDSKMPKIKFRLAAQKRKYRKRSTSNKQSQNKRKNENDIEIKLKHLKTVNDRDVNIDSDILSDKKMMYSIPYVKLNFQSDSDTEIEIVEPSTSRSPTKPPRLISKKALATQTNSSDLKNGDSSDKTLERTRKKRSSRGTVKKPKNQTKNITISTSKRSVRLTTSKNKKKRQIKRVTKKNNKKIIKKTAVKKENPDDKICFICKREFDSKCDKKLHELEHNISFSPIILLDKFMTKDFTNFNQTNTIDNEKATDNSEVDDKTSENILHTSETSEKNKENENEKNKENEDEDNKDDDSSDLSTLDLCSIFSSNSNKSNRDNADKNDEEKEENKEDVEEIEEHKENGNGDENSNISDKEDSDKDEETEGGSIEDKQEQKSENKKEECKEESSEASVEIKRVKKKINGIVEQSITNKSGDNKKKSLNGDEEINVDSIIKNTSPITSTPSIKSASSETSTIKIALSKTAIKNATLETRTIKNASSETSPIKEDTLKTTSQTSLIKCVSAETSPTKSASSETSPTKNISLATSTKSVSSHTSPVKTASSKTSPVKIASSETSPVITMKSAMISLEANTLSSPNKTISPIRSVSSETSPIKSTSLETSPIKNSSPEISRKYTTISSKTNALSSPNNNTPPIKNTLIEKSPTKISSVESSPMKSISSESMTSASLTSLDEAATLENPAKINIENGTKELRCEDRDNSPSKSTSTETDSNDIRLYVDSPILIQETSNIKYSLVESFLEDLGA